MSEFVYHGEVRNEPDSETCSDSEWTDYVFNRSGIPAVKKEWWCHIPSNIWFIAERDTAKDHVLRTYLYGEGS